VESEADRTPHPLQFLRPPTQNFDDRFDATLSRISLKLEEGFRGFASSYTFKHFVE
jgi:hypothetical protein